MNLRSNGKSWSVVLAAAMIFAGFVENTVANADSLTLTAGELAEGLGVYWWNFQVPNTFKPGDGINCEWISSDGAVIAGPAFGYNTRLIKPGMITKIFCRNERERIVVSIVTPDGVTNNSYPESSLKGLGAGISNKPNGSLLKDGDIFLTLIKPGMNGGPGAFGLKPGDVGLKVFISSAAAAQN